MEVEIINQLGITNPHTFFITAMAVVFACLLLGIWRAGFDIVVSTMLFLVAVFIVAIIGHTIEESNRNKKLAAKILATKDFVVEEIIFTQNTPTQILLRSKTPLTTDIYVAGKDFRETLPKQLASISVRDIDKVNSVLVAHNTAPLIPAHK